MDKVRSVQRTGGWSGLHKRYRRAAHHALQEIKCAHSELGKLSTMLDAASGGTGLKRLLDEYIAKLEVYCNLAASAQMYCAMAIEALLNFYGVSRLGETFYRRNLERLPVIQKFEMLMAICEGNLYTKENDLSEVLQKIAGRRNALVHPKAHEFLAGKGAHHVEPGDWPNRIPKDVKGAIDDMELFFKKFSALSVDCRAAVEFFD